MDPLSPIITALSATTSYTNSAANGTQQFYHVRVLP